METIKALCNASQRFVNALIRASDSVVVAQTMNQGGGSSSGGNGAAAQSNAGASSDSTTDRLLRKKFFDLLVQVDTRCCVPVQSHMSRCSTAGDYRTPR
jgi:hypothetical protein